MEQLPRPEEVRVAIDEIVALIGLAASFPQSRFAEPAAEDEHRYQTLWRSIDGFLIRLQKAGLPLRHRNPHRQLKEMWGYIWAKDRSGRERKELPACLYEETQRELQALVEVLGEADVTEEVLRDLRESRRRTNELFVAMPFDPELNAFFEKVVEPAARAAGLDPVRIDRRPPEGYITEAILSTIRRAVLVLVDLTLERPNCYFEAGYARGAFRRAIFTCRADHDPRRTDRGSYRVHFDADTFPIIWWQPDDLASARAELEGRLQAELWDVRAEAH